MEVPLRSMRYKAYRTTTMVIQLLWVNAKGFLRDLKEDEKKAMEMEEM